MVNVSSILQVLSVAFLAVNCGTQAGDADKASSPAVTGEEESGGEGRGSLSCGTDVCSPDEMCVETIGALCAPLPEPGQSCDDGCTLTEHCCNCPAFGCLEPSREDCPDGPSCDCLTRSNGESILIDCEGERRQCSQDEGWTYVTCTLVALDEDPFAEEEGLGGNAQP